MIGLYMLAGLLTVYGLVGCLLFVFQGRLIYFPSPEKLDTPDWQIIPSDKIPGVTLGYRLERKAPATVVLFHGNGGSAVHRTYFSELLPDDVNIVIAEYPGYGRNAGQPVGKEQIIEQARALIRMVSAQNKPLILVGESLGTGVASQMAVEFDVPRLVLLNPYASVKEVAQAQFPFFPVGWMLRENYDNVANLVAYRGCTLIVLSEEDEVIPAYYGERLYSSLSGEKRKLVARHARHLRWWEHFDVSQRKTFVDFFRNP